MRPQAGEGGTQGGELGLSIGWLVSGGGCRVVHVCTFWCRCQVGARPGHQGAVGGGGGEGVVAGRLIPVYQPLVVAAHVRRGLAVSHGGGAADLLRPRPHLPLGG